MIAELAEEKGWGCDVSTKIYYAMIELGEAGDIWKHREDKEYLKNLKIPNVYGTVFELAVAEELIDTIFYCLHALYCLNPSLNVDQLFEYKFNVNTKRNRFYADDMK